MNEREKADAALAAAQASSVVEQAARAARNDLRRQCAEADEAVEVAFVASVTAWRAADAAEDEAVAAGYPDRRKQEPG